LSSATLAVIVISNPGIDVDGLVCSYQLIKGVMPKDGVAIALFIDRGCVVGGVGAGCHGVGVEHRGVGIR